MNSILVVKMTLNVQVLLINIAFFTFLNSVEPGQHEREREKQRLGPPYQGDLAFYLQHSNSGLALSYVLAVNCPEEQIHFLNLKSLSCFMKHTQENIFPKVLQLKKEIVCKGGLGKGGFPELSPQE